MSFATFGLSPALIAPLARRGYHHPTPVQAQSIPLVLDGHDLLGRAQTGTGKTAAFGLPMIERLLVRGRQSRRPRQPRGLILVPTRELALQVHAALLTYGAPMSLKAAAIFGGVAMRPQVVSLQRGVDIVVATPGRLIDHLEQRAVDLSGVEILTLDEADRMLDMGFMPALRRLVEALPRARQTLLFSATFSPEIVRLAAQFTREAKHVDVSDRKVVAPTVTHRVHPVSDGRKGELLRHLLTLPAAGQALVFCRTKHGSDRVGRALERAGVKSAVIHGNKSQNARTRALGDLKAGRVAVLVATDVAARGLDIAQLPMVVNYDLPLVPEDYVHRVGRTGRAGASGHAVSLVAPADRPLLRAIQRLLPSPLEEVVVNGFELTEAEMAVVPTAPVQPRRYGATPGPHRPPRHRKPARPGAGPGARPGGHVHGPGPSGHAALERPGADRAGTGGRRLFRPGRQRPRAAR
jgi:ATP-dependent RNA helicase RhlE